MRDGQVAHGRRREGRKALTAAGGTNLEDPELARESSQAMLAEIGEFGFGHESGRRRRDEDLAAVAGITREA